MDRISIIVRFHTFDRFWLLKRAVFSLATQDYSNFQVIIACQNISDTNLNKICEYLSDCGIGADWGPTSTKSAQITTAYNSGPHYVFSINLPSGVDGRSILINEGLHFRNGRYLAFLDYDDIIYSDAYSRLVKSLKDSNAAISAGGTRIALCHQEPNRESLYVEHKYPFLKRQHHALEIFYDNFIPIHSFVVDMERLKYPVKFREDLKCNEDWHFILQIAKSHLMNLDFLNIPVCEYVLRADGTNTICYGTEKDSNKEADWAAAREELRKYRSEMKLEVQATEIIALVHEMNKLHRNDVRLFLKMSDRFLTKKTLRKKIYSLSKYFYSWVLRAYRGGKYIKRYLSFH